MRIRANKDLQFGNYNPYTHKWTVLAMLPKGTEVLTIFRGHYDSFEEFVNDMDEMMFTFDLPEEELDECIYHRGLLLMNRAEDFEVIADNEPKADSEILLVQAPVFAPKRVRRLGTTAVRKIRIDVIGK